MVRIWIQELILLGPRGGGAKEFVGVSRVHLVVSRRQVLTAMTLVNVPGGSLRAVGNSLPAGGAWHIPVRNSYGFLPARFFSSHRKRWLMDPEDTNFWASLSSFAALSLTIWAKSAC